MSTNALTVVIDLVFLASEVNDAHKQVTFHARSMLLEAKRAGEALLAAKKSVKHGEFKAWVELNCRCSYPRARKYMLVTKHCASKMIDPDQFEDGIDSFLEAHSTPRKGVPKAPVAMDTADAEYVLKLHAMVERASPNEREVAARKLAEKAKNAFGLSPDEAVAEAQRLLPDQDKSTEQRTSDEKLRKAEARIAEVEAQLERLITRKAEIRSQFNGCSREELLELVVDLHLQLDPAG